jgi:tetratricopeptide (TPR) repeat protein
VSAGRAQDAPIDVLRSWQLYNNTGWEAFNRRKYDRAATAFRLAIQELKPYALAEKRLLARSYADLAKVLYHQNHYEEAEPLARWALLVRESAPGTKSEALRQNLDLLARIQRARRRHDGAERILKRLAELQERYLGPGHPELIVTVESLAAVLAEQGKLAESEPVYRRALTLREENTAENVKLAEALEKRAELARLLHAVTTEPRPEVLAQAESLEERARTIRETTAESVGTAVTTEGYASLLRKSGRVAEADELTARAKAIRDAAETRAARARSGR